jgi:hypothetical protein
LTKLNILILGLCCMLLPGCGNGFKTVPVSGRITYKGKPLAKAWIMFAPVAANISAAAGPSSTARTDEEGRFPLNYVDDPKIKGAIVGMHLIRINMLDSEMQKPGDESRDADDPKTIAARKGKLQIPSKYNDTSELKFEVKDGGTDQANFDLK